MFSSRLKWESHPNALSHLLDEKRRDGVQILDLTESNPTRAGLDYPSEIVSALSDPRSLRYDPDPRGLADARAAAAVAMRTTPDRILLTASTSEAYTYIFKLLCDAGDEVLVPRPSYPLFEYLAGLESVTVRQYPLRYDGEWRVDFPSLERAIGPRTRAIVVVNPNNPTGSYLKSHEIERLEQFGLPILSDEVFADYELIEGIDKSLVGDRNVLTFSMGGLSKAAGLPQMKLGWVALSGPGHQEALERLEWIADTFLSVASPVQHALPKLLEFGVGIREQIRSRTRSNLEHLRSALTGSRLGVLHVEGGWYATVRAPQTRSEEEYALTLLRVHDTLIQPGYFYDFESEAFLILSLLTPPEVFQGGVRALLMAH